jgi:calcium-dependent protein kinase
MKIYEFFQDDKYFYIVSELCTGGELFDKIVEVKSFDENLAADIMGQLLSAVTYCHSKKIVHRFKLNFYIYITHI